MSRADRHRDELQLGSREDFLRERAEKRRAQHYSVSDGRALATPYWNPDHQGEENAGTKLEGAGRVCQNCGRKVPPDYHRVQSDSDGVLWHCGGEDGCVTQSAMKKGAGAKPDFERRCPDTGGEHDGSK